MWLVCGKCRSTWYKCHLSHDLFSPCCPWYLYVGQQNILSSIKLHSRTNTSMHYSFLRCTKTESVVSFFTAMIIEKFSPTLALLWIRVDTRMVIWYVCDNGKHVPDSSVTHIEAKRSFSYIQFHSTEKNLLLSKFDTSSCGVVLQSIAWCAPPAQSEFKPRLTVSADRQPF